MQTTRSRTTILGKVSGIVSVGVLLFLLTLGSPNVKGQNLLKAGFPRCAYPPLTPRPNGLGLGGAEVLGGQVHQHPLPAITTIMRCAYPPLAGAGGGSASSSKQNLVQKIYTSQLGVREKQPNSGKEVEKYLRYVNLPKGNPWCAAFVCWTLGEAGISNPRTGWSPGLFGERYIIWGKGVESGKRVESGKLKGESFHRFAYSQQTPNHGVVTRSTYSPTQTSDFRLQTSVTRRCACPPLAGVGGGFCTHKPQVPRSGDVFGLYFPEKGRIAHVGFVDEWEDGWVTTVEGNTNVLGSREGDGVYRKRRLVRSIYKVARYVN